VKNKWFGEIMWRDYVIGMASRCSSREETPDELQAEYISNPDLILHVHGILHKNPSYRKNMDE